MPAPAGTKRVKVSHVIFNTPTPPSPDILKLPHHDSEKDN